MDADNLLSSYRGIAPQLTPSIVPFTIPFLELPGEIRKMIYDLTVGAGYIYTKDNFHDWDWPATKCHYVGLLRTCRQVYREAMPPFYEEIELRSWVSEASELVERLSSRAIQSVRELRMEWTCGLTDLRVSKEDEPWLWADVLDIFGRRGINIQRLSISIFPDSEGDYPQCLPGLCVYPTHSMGHSRGHSPPWEKLLKPFSQGRIIELHGYGTPEDADSLAKTLGMVASMECSYTRQQRLTRNHCGNGPAGCGKGWQCVTLINPDWRPGIWNESGGFSDYLFESDLEPDHEPDSEEAKVSTPIATTRPRPRPTVGLLN